MEKKIPRSLKKYIRRKKAEVRKTESNLEKQKILIIELLKELNL